MEAFKPRPGQIDFTHERRAPVVNCIVKHDDKILIVRRNRDMQFHPGVWDGISGFLDEADKTVADKVREELAEEVGIVADDIISIKEGEVFEQEDEANAKTWIVHPVLVEVKTNSIQLNWEAEQYAWIDLHELGDYELVPGFDEVMETFYGF